MKKLVFPIMIIIGCTKPAVYPPVGGVLSKKDLEVSKSRAKNLNANERLLIEEWIKNQEEKFYPMSQNYWVNIENLNQRPRKKDGETVSYGYELYDFNMTKLYPELKKKQNVQLGRFEDLKAVEDVLRYLDKGQKATLLVPSVLAFGTYGDNDKIPNDMPIIIKITAL